MNGKQLKNSILQWAIQGKLVPQDSSDEPAIELLKRFNPKIKPITEDVPFEVPESWVWCSIGDIGNVCSARRVHQKDWRKSGIPFYRAREIGKLSEYGYVNNELYIDKELYNSLSVSGIPRAGDLMITAVGTLGKVYIVQENDVFYYKDASVICLENRLSLCSKYIRLVIESPFFVDQFTQNSQGTTVGTLTMERFNKYFFPLPPLAEQKRIVEKIEELMPLVERYTKAQEGLDKLNEGIKGKLRASILQEAIQGKLVPQDASEEPAVELLKRINPKFKPVDYEGELPEGWSVAMLSDICDTINGLWKGKKEPFIKVGVIRNANFTKDFKLDYSKIEYLDVEEKSFKKRNLLNGDLIVEKSGGGEKTPVGRSILYEGEEGIYSFSNFTMLLRIKDKKEILPKYLYYFLLSKYWSGAMFDMQTNTTGLHNLLTDIYLSINVPLPPLAEQKRIVAKIEELFGVLDRL